MASLIRAPLRRNRPKKRRDHRLRFPHDRSRRTANRPKVSLAPVQQLRLPLGDDGGELS
jgi:hypothetical protein